MMIATPVPAAAGAPASPVPSPAPAQSSPTAPVPTAPAPDAEQQPAPGTVKTPPPAGEAGPTDAADAAAQAAIDKLESTSAMDALAQVDEHLKQVSAMSVGGPDGEQGAKAAADLLTDASMLLQHANVKAMQQLRDLATELQMRVMSSASALAFVGGQVALAGTSKEPVKLADVVAEPVAQTEAAMADIAAVIAPKPEPEQTEPAQPEAEQPPAPEQPAEQEAPKAA